jgi:hypothetical protein
MTSPGKTERVFQISSFIRVFLVLAVLLCHFASRDRMAHTMPLIARHIYSENYAIALSLNSGKGFNDLQLTDAPQAQSIKLFLQLERESLSRQEVDTYFKSAYQVGPLPQMVADRILDIRVAALIWKVFGVHWSALFRFYSALSTLVCLLVFFSARRLSGSYWAGLFAALCFTACVVEDWLASWSIRDASPLWFSAIAFFWLICLTDRSQSRSWNLLSISGLGAVSLLGYGWRSDAYFLLPFMLGLLVLWLVQKRRNVPYVALSAVLFLLGAWSTKQLIQYWGSKEIPSISAQGGFHVADYGDSTRSNLFGLENSFEIPRDDRETSELVDFYWHVRNPDKSVPAFLSPGYAVAARDLYVAYLKYNAFNWYREFPNFYLRTIGNAAVPGKYLSTLGDTAFPPWVLEIGERCSLPAAIAFIAAAFPLFLMSRNKIFLIGLYLFSIYYCSIFLLVLPEGKHTAVFVLPIAIVGGLTLHAITRAFRQRDLIKNTLGLSRQPFRMIGLGAVVLISLWSAGFVAFYYYCRAERAEYIENILQLAGRSPMMEASDKQAFSATLSTNMPVQGYLLKIRTGRDPGFLITRHMRVSSGSEDRSFAYATTHSLYPNREQYYYVTLAPAAFLGDSREYRCNVTLEGESELVSSTPVDLHTWKRPAFNTVFYQGESVAGSPKLRANLRSTELLSLDAEQRPESFPEMEVRR